MRSGLMRTELFVVFPIVAVVLLAGCASGSPSPQEMARVYATGGPDLVNQMMMGMVTNTMAAGGQLSQDQVRGAALEPLFQAAKRCGMSRKRCWLGVQKLQSDPAYSQAVTQELTRLMMSGR